jgi:predicted alpha/beta hydrolase family esterase
MSRRNNTLEEHAEANISIWKEALFGAELLLLHASPVYYGFGIPRGDGAGVVVIPGFLGNDEYLAHMHGWLDRIGYRTYVSGINVNAECPNLLIREKLSKTIDKALNETGGKVHLVGHSLGGVIARSVACQRPHDIASVITIASPFRGVVAHHAVLSAAKAVRTQILKDHRKNVMPDCYTARCTCEFICSLKANIPNSVAQTAICTQDDGVVDWRYCLTHDPELDFEVPGTHIGLAFNASVYRIIASRLAWASQL